MPDQKIPPVPANPTRLTFEEWFERFQPIKNHLDSNASHDGYMFETYDAELAFVHSVRADAPQMVWTITSSGDYSTLGDGYHYVDREGYFICTVPVPEGESFEIVLHEPDEEDLQLDADGQRFFDAVVEAGVTIDLVEDLTEREAGQIWQAIKAKLESKDEPCDQASTSSPTA